MSRGPDAPPRKVPRVAAKPGDDARENADEAVDEAKLVDIAPVGAEGHEVEAGECASSIADATGHLLETLWNDPRNAELRKRRKDPRVLRPADRVFVPELRLGREAAKTAQVNVFVRHGVPEHLFMQILGPDGEPLADRRYRVSIDGKMLEPAQTDGEGHIELSIPAQAKRAELHLHVAPPDVPGLELVDPELLERTFAIEIGRLEPIESPRGGAQRLINLGFLSPYHVEEGEFLDAVAQFQDSYGLTVSGEYDEPTQKALGEAHGT